MTDATTSGEQVLKIRDKILIGGLGALTPIIMNLLVVDLENLLLGLTPLTVIAYIIKVTILFYIGGIVAYLNKDENKPVKLFQLGIYAPAMIIAFMNTNPFKANVTPQPEIAPAPEKIEEKAKDEDKNAALFNGKKTIDFLAASSSLMQIFQDDTTKERAMEHVTMLKDKTVRSSMTDSLWIDPLLELIVRQNAPFLDTLAGNIATHMKELEQVQLQDSDVHEFKYPKETATEQFFRGFFGWKSDRLWFVVVGKFDTKKEAVNYAKLITRDMNSRNLSEVADIPGQILIPQIFKPYGTIVPEYCVVIGKHLTFPKAQTVRSKIVRQNLGSVNPDHIEIWKLPID